MYDLISIGDIKLDTFITLPNASVQCTLKKNDCLLCLEYGKKIPVSDFDSQIAGSAPNVAVGMSRMGYNSSIYSVMGEDDTTDQAFKKLGQEGVDTRYIETARGKHSTFSAVINFKGERTILTSHQPFHYHLPRLAPSKWIYVGELGEKYEYLYTKLIPLINKKKINLGLNPGTIQLEEKKKPLMDLIRATTVLFVNMQEAEMLVGNSNKTIEMLIHEVWKLGPKIVVITDGSAGAYAFSGAEIIHCPVFPAKKVETTGAGDAFSTGFLSALMSNKKINDALLWGSVNAASVISKVGPQPGLLTKSQILSRIRKGPKIKTKNI